MQSLESRSMIAIVAMCALAWLSAVAPAMTETADMKPGREVGFNDKLADTYAEAVDFHYTHLWTSKNGTTQFAECHMKGFKSQVYAEGTPPLMVKSAILPPNMLNFIQDLKSAVFGHVQFYHASTCADPQDKDLHPVVPPNQAFDAHNCPASQFVTVMQGSWWVQASNGQRRNFSPGEVMFQDDTADNPADQSPKHSSGTYDDLCNQLYVQVDWNPEFDNPCPF